MNMTVLFKKCTYGLLLIATTIISFCNAQSMTDQECIAEYDLLPRNYVDQNYCITNNLCPNEIENTITINGIEHITTGHIVITIPEEIQRDYTTNENTFNLTIEGYGYNAEKITNIINTQNYKPTPEEMSELVGKIANFLPLVAITLLILRAWRLIKKLIFKS